MADEWGFTLGRIVCFGDSITQESFENVGGSPGWGSQVQAAYVRVADVFNRGFSGYTTESGIRILQRVFPRGQHGHGGDNGVYSRLLVTVFFGANDASVEGTAKHVPLEVFEANITATLDHIDGYASDAGIPLSLVVLGAPPVHREQRLAYQVEKYGEKANGVPERSQELAAEYAATAVRAAEAYAEEQGWGEREDRRLSTIDCSVEMVAAKPDTWGEFLRDGLHLSPEGNTFVAKRVLKAFKADLAPYNFNNGFLPHHSLLDTHDKDELLSSSS